MFMSTLKRAILKDYRKEQELNAKGFVYIPGFLSQKELLPLFQLYQKHHSHVSKEQGMWNSLFDLTKENAVAISQEILFCLQTKLSELFISSSAPVASFMSKNPGEKGVCEFHRDFSIMNEEEFEYRNLWIPLVDVSKRNGALYALKGSHLQYNYPLPMFQKWPYIEQHEELFKHASIFEVSAGDLVIYTDRTLHGSFLNLSETTRPVIHLGVLHPDFETAYYHFEDGIVKVYKVPFDFYFKNEFGNLDGRYPLIRIFEYLPPCLTYKT